MRAQRIVDRNACAQKRGCVFAIERFGNRAYKSSVGTNPVRIAAMPMDTGGLCR